jgi:hypothetical protein
MDVRPFYCGSIEVQIPECTFVQVQVRLTPNDQHKADCLYMWAREKNFNVRNPP